MKIYLKRCTFNLQMTKGVKSVDNLHSKVIQKPEHEARICLQRLVEAGLVEAKGERKGRTYHFSSSTYRRLGEESAYVRQRGFEPLQQEQMILQYVETHGSITRKDVADLCKLSFPQAYRLLQKLAGKRLIEQVGNRGRGVAYKKARPEKHGKQS